MNVLILNVVLLLLSITLVCLYGFAQYRRLQGETKKRTIYTWPLQIGMSIVILIIPTKILLGTVALIFHWNDPYDRFQRAVGSGIIPVVVLLSTLWYLDHRARQEEGDTNS